jgi:prevent-host-death family protein
VRIGIRDLRANAAVNVRRAAAGERLTVTVGGRPVAQLGPLEAGTDASLDALLASGQLLAPRRYDRSVPSDPIPVFAGVRLDRLLRELRG